MSQSRNRNSLSSWLGLMAVICLMCGWTQLTLGGWIPFIWKPIPDTWKSSVEVLSISPKTRVYVYGDFEKNEDSRAVFQEWSALVETSKAILPYEFVFVPDVPRFARSQPMMHWQDRDYEWQTFDWAGKRPLSFCQDFYKVYQARDRYLSTLKSR